MAAATRRQMMREIDQLSPELRELVNEYSVHAINAALDDGELPEDDEEIEELREQLSQDRFSKQMAWLRTDHITPRVAEKFRDALLKWTRRPKVP